MFGKKPKVKQYNPDIWKAVIRCSICTGEQVAGFQNIHTGKLEEIMLIRDEKDLKCFKEMYGVEKCEKIF